MRTYLDRLRHTILFEAIALVISVPLAAWALNREIGHIGTMAICLSLAAMACNYLFNLAFDHMLIRLGRPVHHRPPRLRIIHALLFESSFIALTVPFVAWWLGMTLWKAFMTDISFAAFFLVYAYLYNWVYDHVFPMVISTKTQPDS